MRKVADGLSLLTIALSTVDAFQLGCLVPGQPQAALSTRCPARGMLGLYMQEEAVNREQRRMQKKAEKRRQAGAASKGFSSPDEALSKVTTALSETASDSGLAAGVAGGRPQSIDDLRQTSMSDSEQRMVAKAEGYNTKKPELVGYEELRQMDPRVLASTEKFLFGAVVATGAAWVLAGLAVAYDAFMVSTKKELPAGFDKVLSNYVEPFLTPGIVGIFLLSGLLGLLQFYKFEGGKSGASRLNEARALTNEAKRRKERGPL